MPSGTAQIPFDFSVEDQTIAAGDFKIKRYDDRGGLWLFSSKGNRELAIVTGVSVGAERILGNDKITFRRYGNKYFLAGLEMINYKIGFGKSRAERRLEKRLKNNIRLAKNNVNEKTPEIITVSLAM